MIAELALTGVLLVAPATGEQAAESSAAAQDMRGYEPSLYRGIFWHAKWETLRKCIMRRESHFNYRARSKVSSASGAYQFLDNHWRRGLVYMMVKESKKTGDTLQNEAKELFHKPINTWSRYWQDRAFYTALQHGEGMKHWLPTVKGSTSCGM